MDLVFSLALFLVLSGVVVYYKILPLVKSVWLQVIFAVVFLVLGLYILLLGTIFGGAMLDFEPPRPFSKELWEKRPDLRYTMGDYLVLSNELKGLTRKEVKEKLGPGRESEKDIYYDLGSSLEGFVTIRFYTLYIYFNNQEIVENVELSIGED